MRALNLRIRWETTLTLLVSLVTTRAKGKLLFRICLLVTSDNGQGIKRFNGERDVTFYRARILKDVPASSTASRMQ
ncbi:hypothetical protein ACS0PU_006090 [Formica fusca]